MGYYVYIIYSGKLDKYYVGYSEDILTRLEQHNGGVSAFTSKANDWRIEYSESFETRQQAHWREKEIKSKKSRKYIEWLIGRKA
jgi:putative endonuclease